MAPGHNFTKKITGKIEKSKNRLPGEASKNTLKPDLAGKRKAQIFDEQNVMKNIVLVWTLIVALSPQLSS